MKDRLANKPGRILITPENGSAPFYATIKRADEPMQEGDELNKGNLLKDQTAARFGKGNDSVPDTIFDQIAHELDRYTHAQAGGVKMAVGSYVGNGKSSSVDALTGEIAVSNPTVLECGFAPKLVWVRDGDQSSWMSPPALTYPTRNYVGGDDDDAFLEWGETSLKIYSKYADAYAQFNAEGTSYSFVAIGLGNTGLDWDRLDYLTLLDEEEEADV